VWRCRDLFDALELPLGVLLNTSLYDDSPEVVAAFRPGQYRWATEMIGHGHTNAERQADLGPAAERALITACTRTMLAAEGRAPAGWLSPWISESLETPDLLAEAGYRYTLDWCHDDQPLPLATRAGRLWSVPYPQEVNDIPMIVARQMSGDGFARLIVDTYDEMLEQSALQPLVMGIALHPYLVGQPARLRHLRAALTHLRRSGQAWWCTPGQIVAHVEGIDAVNGLES
jgi:peptidoglycan/xylan/chitin deacetylase (PgdA/CDA1 family)